MSILNNIKKYFDTKNSVINQYLEIEKSLNNNKDESQLIAKNYNLYKKECEELIKNSNLCEKSIDSNVSCIESRFNKYFVNYITKLSELKKSKDDLLYKKNKIIKNNPFILEELEKASKNEMDVDSAIVTLVEGYKNGLISKDILEKAKKNILEKANEIKGGKADNKTIEQIANKHKVTVDDIKKQLKIGIKIEREHVGGDKNKAIEITMDHLWEQGDYYTSKKPENWAKKELDKEKGVNFDIEKGKKEVDEALKHEDKLGEGAKKRRKLSDKKDKFSAVMAEFGRGTLHSGDGSKVTDKDQAIAIAYSESGLKKAIEEFDFTDEQKQKISEFIKNYKGEFKDEDIHSFADKLKLDKHEVEEYIYSIAKKELNKAIDFTDSNKETKSYVDAIVSNKDGKILFLKRSKFSEFEPDKYCLPGGHIDINELPENAVLRELKEETGLVGKIICKIGELDKPKIHYFLCDVLDCSLIILDESEHINYRWMCKDEYEKENLIMNLKENLIKMFDDNYKVKKL